MAIVFSLPASARYFTPFVNLPVELRVQIWEDAIYQPGMNFLRVSYNTSTRRSHHGGTFPPLRKATLVPIYQHPEAEDSQFYNLDRVLQTLSLVCEESRRVVRRFMAYPSTIKLPNGQVVTVRDSHDAICLDYVPENIFTSGCRILADVKCPGLDQIRHIAIRYCHNWETKSSVCRECMRSHSADTKNKALPLHVYQFLVRHMPNLQTVYFIDFLILRHVTEDLAAGPPPTFTSRGRSFYEVNSANDGCWEVGSQVFEVLDWVRANYLRYSAQSTTTRHRHRQPRRVQFKVLACEQVVAPAVQSPAPRTQLSVWKKGGNKREYQGETRDASKRRQVDMPAADIAHVEALSVFVFGQDKSFPFTFSAVLRKIRGTDTR